MKKILICTLLALSLYATDGCEERTFTIKNSTPIPIRDYISNLSEECGYTLLIKDKFVKRKLKERITALNLEDVTLHKILDILLTEHNIDYTLSDNILKLRYLITKTFHIDYVKTKRLGKAVIDASVTAVSEGTTSGSTAGGSGGDVNTISSTDEFDFWQGIKEEIYGIINRPEDEYKAPQPIININAGLVTVTATKNQIQRLQDYIDNIEDTLHKEVMIEVSILAVFLNSNITTGIDWSRFNLTLNGQLNPDGTLSPGNPILQYQAVATGKNFTNMQVATSASAIIDSAFNLSGIIDFLKKNGDVVTLSNPKIVTLNNQPAIITIGDTINYNVPTTITINQNGSLGTQSYTPSSIFVGILLNITPEITKNNDIILRINPSISELKNPDIGLGTNSKFREIAPDTKEKKISSVVKLHNNSTLILGGLISDTKNFQINGVPVLKDIPILGHMFKSTNKAKSRFELVFIIRPKIVDLKSNTLPSLKSLGYTKIHNVK